MNRQKNSILAIDLLQEGQLIGRKKYDFSVSGCCGLMKELLWRTVAGFPEFAGKAVSFEVSIEQEIAADPQRSDVWFDIAVEPEEEERSSDTNTAFSGSVGATSTKLTTWSLSHMNFETLGWMFAMQHRLQPGSYQIQLVTLPPENTESLGFIIENPPIRLPGTSMFRRENIRDRIARIDMSPAPEQWLRVVFEKETLDHLINDAQKAVDVERGWVLDASVVIDDDHIVYLVVDDFEEVKATESSASHMFIQGRTLLPLFRKRPRLAGFAHTHPRSVAIQDGVDLVINSPSPSGPDVGVGMAFDGVTTSPSFFPILMSQMESMREMTVYGFIGNLFKELPVYEFINED